MREKLVFSYRNWILSINRFLGNALFIRHRYIPTNIIFANVYWLKKLLTVIMFIHFKDKFELKLLDFIGRIKLKQPKNKYN